MSELLTTSSIYTVAAADPTFNRTVPADPFRELELAIEYMSIAALKPYARNARTHSKKQIRQIAGT